MLLELLVRKNVWNLAKSMVHDKDDSLLSNDNLRLDNNENPYNDPLNRFPDPNQTKLRNLIARIKKVEENNIYFANGTDELADFILRVFCRPQIDNIVTVEPTRSLYRKVAILNDVEYRTVKLNDNFQFKPDDLLKLCDNNTKVIFLCSPNNPTGNAFDFQNVMQVVDKAQSIVVIDESFAGFTELRSFDTLLKQYPNLIVLHSFSYAWASAALRLGMAFANKQIIQLMQVVGRTYPVSYLSQQFALKTFDDKDTFYNRILDVNKERDRTIRALIELPWIIKVYPSITNFFILKVKNAEDLYAFLRRKNVCVKLLKTGQPVDNCIRITVGNRVQNSMLIAALRNYSPAQLS